MKLEIGKFYRTRDGRKVGPMFLNDDDPSRYGHFKAPREMWMYFAPMWQSDGLFWPNEKRDQDLVAEWTEAAAAEPPCTCHPDDKPPVPCVRKYALNDCRAAAEPEIEWGEWGEGRENWKGDRQCQIISGHMQWRYPVPKKPVVKTVTLFGHLQHGNRMFGARGDMDTARITFETRDGKPDWSTLRGEDIS